MTATRGLRRLFRPRGLPEAGESWESVLARHVERRLRDAESTRVAPGLFSILTTVYDTPAPLLHDAARSLFDGSDPTFEWVILDNGSNDPRTLAALEEIAADERVKLLRAAENVGIGNGMRTCLQAASGDYILPFDSDDLLTPDALATVARELANAGYPAFLYSDEDMLVDGRPQTPYFRPDWDPVLNTCTSYVFHLAVFRRTDALELGVYSDPDATWCHDWDTVFRFTSAGHAPVHLPEVLYHWRTHARSTTNRRDPRVGSLASQKHVLQRHVIDPQPDSNLYELELHPIPRGTPEWWIRRRRVGHPPMSAIIIRAHEQQTEASFHDAITRSGVSPASLQEVTGLPRLTAAASAISSGLVVVASNAIEIDGNDWLWEALCLFELHADTAIVAGRLVADDRVVAEGGFFDATGVVYPFVGRLAIDPGPWAYALKQRTVDAPDAALFVADAEFLRTTLPSLPAVATPGFLGGWLGASAIAAGRRVTFSPLVSATARADFTPGGRPNGPELAVFRQRFPGLLDGDRPDPPLLSWPSG